MFSIKWVCDLQKNKSEQFYQSYDYYLVINSFLKT